MRARKPFRSGVEGNPAHSTTGHMILPSRLSADEGRRTKMTEPLLELLHGATLVIVVAVITAIIIIIIVIIVITAARRRAAAGGGMIAIAGGRRRRRTEAAAARAQ